MKKITTTYLYYEADRRVKELKEVCRELEVSIAKAPKGKIHIKKSKGKFQFYLRRNPSEITGQYLSKKDKYRISGLMKKAYEEKVLKVLLDELCRLEEFVKQSQGCIDRMRALYSSYPEELKVLVQPLDCSDEDYIRMWSELPYEGKKVSENVPVYLTERGERVRSKSELNIANALYQKKIPYRYEAPLHLWNGNVIYPDFTVLHVRSRKEIYWEHRGMMDDRDYCRYAVERKKEMERSGLRQGKDWIITEETLTQPLGTDDIENTIRQYFW